MSDRRRFARAPQNWLAALLLVVALAAALWRAPAPYAKGVASAPFEAKFCADCAASAPAKLTTTLITLPSTALPSAHAASLATASDGGLFCAWFAGSREGAADVAIYLSRLDKGVWSPPRAILRPEDLTQRLLRPVRKLGNPVIYVDAAGRLHLFVVSVSIGGWAGGSINHLVSADAGQTWQSARRLMTAPFFNLGTLVRTSPLPLADGGLLLPAYHEFGSKFGLALTLNGDMQLSQMAVIPAKRPTLQPALALNKDNNLLALLRDAGPSAGQIQVAQGRQNLSGVWRFIAAPPLPIANHDSSVALLRLPSNELLLAANAGKNREALSLFVSHDEGAHWRERPLVRGTNGEEYSYPALAQTADGMIYLAYTWRRQTIAVASFNQGWLDEAHD